MPGIMVFMAQNVPEGRLFALDSQTLISIGIQLINAIILAVALSFILYKPTKEFMQKRAERIKTSLDNADRAMARANELIVEYNMKLEQIDSERAEILEAARLKAAEQSREILEQAKREAEEIRRHAKESLEKDRKLLEEQTRLYVIELASVMAEKYIARKIDDEAQDRLFEEAVAQLEEAQWLH